jgi:hypothetical protein
MRSPSSLCTMVRTIKREQTKALFKKALSIGEMHHEYSETLKRMSDVFRI